jgi:hypothetical protein
MKLSSYGSASAGTEGYTFVRRSRRERFEAL